jgi:hypothetical protein
MKKMLFIYFGLSLTTFVVSGCGQPAASQSPDPSSYQTQISKSETLTLTLDSKTITIPISNVDSVKKYLDQAEPHERASERNRIQTTSFTSASGTIYGDIKYGCGIKLCNHTLVQIKNNAIKTIPLFSGSILTAHAFSPDEKYLAVLLGRNEGTEVIRQSLMIIELDSFTLAELENRNDVVTMLTSADFTTPILSMSWESETTLKAVIPDTTDYAFDTLKNWKAGENNTKEIFIKVT